MALQVAQMAARVDETRDVVLLEDQDPSQWDRQLIGLGFHHFDLSMGGAEVSRYHVESAIAATHAIRLMIWPRVLNWYDQLVVLDGGASAVI